MTLPKSIRRLAVVLLLLSATVTPAADVLALDASPQLFTTEQAAQKHCPDDTVVWLNLSSGVYHFSGQRWYGTTKNGAYVCRKEADKAGDRATKNGQ